jgi:hypothetical protein
LQFVHVHLFFRGRDLGLSIPQHRREAAFAKHKSSQQQRKLKSAGNTKASA